MSEQVEYDWRMKNFLPVPFCNTYSLHVWKHGNEQTVLICDINGVVFTWESPNDEIWTEEHCFKTKIDLKQYIDEVETCEQLTSELVTSDAVYISSVKRIYLATCWVTYDRLFMPKFHFSALFSLSISSQPILIERIIKFEVQSVSTFTRLTRPNLSNPNELYWLTFNYGNEVQIRSIDFVEDIHQVKTGVVEDVLPPIAIETTGELPGSVLRFHCWTTIQHRYSIFGYDNGSVIITCYAVDSSYVDRKAIKFNAPISVLNVLECVFPVVSDHDHSRLLISSTIGPAAVWAITVNSGKILMQMETILLNSEYYDSITTAEVSPDFFFIGTYAEQMLIYKTNEVGTTHEISPVSVLNVGSPILSICHLSATAEEQEILILTARGIHQYKPIPIPNDECVEFKCAQNSSI